VFFTTEKNCLMSVLKRLGEALVETGQSLQRLGLRASGNEVIKQDRYRTVGAELPDLDISTSIHRNAIVVGRVDCGSWTSIGDSIIRGEVNPVNIGIAVEIGDRTVIHSILEQSTTGLPVFVGIGEESKIGNDVVLVSQTIGVIQLS